MYAADYCGALVSRRGLCKQEVAGSIPARSIADCRERDTPLSLRGLDSPLVRWPCKNTEPEARDHRVDRVFHRPATDDSLSATFGE